MKFKIFPPIGIARIGDSPDEWFIGPEIPGAYQRPEGGYKSADCKIKRQGARFRIFAFDDAHNPILENGRPKEITLADGQITWEVRLGNIKASSHRFLQKLGADGKPVVQRNATVPPADHKTLEIVTGPLAISGQKQTAVFPPGAFRGVPVALGELRTDEAGRLIVLGGHGVSRRILPGGLEKFEPPPEYYDNDDWHDDLSDGPVRASLVIDGVTHTATAGRVIVAPPAFAPAIQPVVSLYDRMWEMMVDDFKDHPVFKDQVMVPKPTFNRDIYPLLRRGRDIAAVYDLKDSPNAHHQLRAAAQDPAYFDALGIVQRLRGPPGSPGFGDMPRAIDDEKANSVGLTKQQYAAMQAWAQGPGISAWINDWTGVPPTPDPFVTPDGMTRAALEACVGRGFRPGIEAGRFLFGVKTAHKDDYIPQDYPKPEYVEPFRLADDDQALPPGKVTAMMAVPWQYDFNACAAEGPRIWWPTHRPDSVFPEAGGPQVRWLATDEDIWDEKKDDGGKFLIDNLRQLGFVVEKDGKLVSTERRIGCRDLSVILARDPISRHQVDAALKNPDLAKQLFEGALKVQVDGCTPAELSIPPGDTSQLDPEQIKALAPEPIFRDAQGQPVLSLKATPTAIKLQTDNPAQAQIVTFVYDLAFADTTAFFTTDDTPILARELT
ncbi:MAG: lodA 2, partial [Caulobacter sp.]|nr:lodA 2 [Caulobacter sp.]